MAYEAKDYSRLLGMPGFSDTLLNNHFTLYKGYVTNTNKAMDTLAMMLKESKTGTPEYAEMKRRFGWEFNGMRLHESFQVFLDALLRVKTGRVIVRQLASAQLAVGDLDALDVLLRRNAESLQ